MKLLAELTGLIERAAPRRIKNRNAPITVADIERLNKEVAKRFRKTTKKESK